MRTRVKICGITRSEDAIAAIEQGCDAIGLVFYDKSPRYVSIKQAAAIAADIPAFISVVGLFVDASVEEIRAVSSVLRLDLLQLHGDETPAECRQYGLPYMKAIRVKPSTNLVQCAADYSDAKALLLDTYAEGVPGGTGQVFDWKIIPANLAKPIVLAGGLNADNVEMAIRQVKPYAVDVSGGVEITKGIKDAAKIAAFMRGVNNAVI
ncbi:N-(5'-phosphoribosyl)anthranilate isomerase [Methylovorus sp. MM2]|uniref:phosphoribosylanthranilate isomerase n=1 Tax=Methylovorus sp. MM2 TaxID=1848038 RepID=UPI0007E0CCEB|nr:phosphoribosylanthranilate isomerase [Methylovorus sp. MM2]OAM52838.1 N-(5'-phosphoribosyl)anthranilate isomerase [Methylovorus sp. MM2]